MTGWVRWPTPMTMACCVTLAGALLLSGCDDSAIPAAPLEPTAAPAAGLTQQQAALVLAKVGDRTITLGDYAATLERMNQIDRLRFQTPQRRRELLQQMIDLELLSMEARKRGLDKDPEVNDAIRQILRDAMLAKAREGIPAPAQISAAEVQAYYEANKEQFREPERRRVATIVLGDLDKSKEVLAKALAITDAKQWGELYFEHSLTAPTRRDPNAPADLAGDMGIVGPPGDSKGRNTSVPEPVRVAVFKVASVGDVLGELVKDGSRYYVVRMVGQSKGHTRSLAEADRAIRVALLQDRIRQQEQALEEQLRKTVPVSVDEDALSQVKVPDALNKYSPLLDNDKPQP